jgi:hypothetical protein
MMTVMVVQGELPDIGLGCSCGGRTRRGPVGLVRQDRHLAHWEPRLGFVEGDWGDKGTAQTDGIEDDCDALDEGGEGEDRGRRQGVESGTVSLSPRLSKHYSIHIIHYNFFFPFFTDKHMPIG